MLPRNQSNFTDSSIEPSIIVSQSMRRQQQNSAIMTSVTSPTSHSKSFMSLISSKVNSQLQNIASSLPLNTLSNSGASANDKMSLGSNNVQQSQHQHLQHNFQMQLNQYKQLQLHQQQQLQFQIQQQLQHQLQQQQFQDQQYQQYQLHLAGPQPVPVLPVVTSPSSVRGVPVGLPPRPKTRRQQHNPQILDTTPLTPSTKHNTVPVLAPVPRAPSQPMPPRASSEEKMKRRLARKAELARASRKRKKAYVGELQRRVVLLNSKLMELEARFNVQTGLTDPNLNLTSMDEDEDELDEEDFVLTPLPLSDMAVQLETPPSEYEGLPTSIVSMDPANLKAIIKACLQQQDTSQTPQANAESKSPISHSFPIATGDEAFVNSMGNK